MNLASKLWAVPVLVLAPACGGQTISGLDGGGDASADGSPAGDAGGPCTTSAQCAPGEGCGFPQAGGCSATGQCFPLGPMCNAYSPGCACSGQTINTICNGLPTGYVPEPLAYSAKCGMMLDGGMMDGGMMFTCGTTSCMAGQQVCYIPANVPNGATCMPSNGCTDCACAQSTFQCISTCKQAGLAIYVQCQ